jgi:hypothetical protein
MRLEETQLVISCTVCTPHENEIRMQHHLAIGRRGCSSKSHSVILSCQRGDA